MAWTYADTLSASYEGAQIEQRQALIDIDRAHVEENWSALQDAKLRLREAEQDAQWIAQKAAHLQRQQQAAQAQAPRNQFGLSRVQEEIAL